MPYFSRAWKFAFGILVGHARAAADGFAVPRRMSLSRMALSLQDVLGLGIDFRQGQQQVLDRDELVLHGRRLLERGVENGQELATGHRL